MKAHLGQEQDPEQGLVLPVLPSVARKGLVWELLCSHGLSLPPGSLAASVERLSVFVCTPEKGRGLRLGSWLLPICLKIRKKHLMVWCLSLPIDKYGLMPEQE